MEEVVSHLRSSFGGASSAMVSSFGAPEWLIRSTKNDSQKGSIFVSRLYCPSLPSLTFSITFFEYQ